MNMRQARKATRGMVTRVEKKGLYFCTIWDRDNKTFVEKKIYATSDKALRKAVQGLVDFELLEVSLIMYAMPGETFRANATKIVEIEEED